MPRSPTSESVPNWQAESLRLTVFPVNADDATATLHWESLLSTLPESVNRRREAPPHVIEEGPWGNARLQVDAQPGQIHWRALPAAPKPDSAMVIGAFAASTSAFRELMERWLATHCPTINRIAFGASLLLPVGSLQDACRNLAGMLPSVTIAPDDTRDFIYRINRRRPSQYEALQINRLATWSSVQSIGFEVMIGAGAPATQVMKEEHFCRLDLDINTFPFHPRGLAQGALDALFGDLVSAAMEIAERGDMP